MSTSEYVRDLKHLESALQGAQARVRTELETIAEKRRIRSREARHVTDHAIVRFLERTGRLDIDAIRLEINERLAESKTFAKCDGLWHSPTGMVYIVLNGSVVTVLSREQSEKYLGRRLTDGGEATAVGARHCPFCAISIAAPSDLVSHMALAHADKLGPVDDAAPPLPDKD